VWSFIAPEALFGCVSGTCGEVAHLRCYRADKRPIVCPVPVFVGENEQLDEARLPLVSEKQAVYGLESLSAPFCRDG